MFKRLTYKYSASVLIAALALGLNAQPTGAYFSDTESSSGNEFRAGTLAFHLEPASNFTPLPLGKGEATSTAVSLVKDGSIDFQYVASTTEVGGELCDYLDLQVKLNDALIYNDLPSAFVWPAMDSASSDLWDFSVALPSDLNDSLQGKICGFKLQFYGWQKGLQPAQGFSDTEELNVLVSAKYWTAPPVVPDVVLNEFLPNPEGSQYGVDFGIDDDSMPKGEWVELYNNSDTAQNLTGWYIRDGLDRSDHKVMLDAAHTGLTTPIIPAKGFLVVFMNKAIFNNTLTTGESDSVRLFNSDDIVVDSYTYTLPADYCNLKPTEGGTNDEKGSGTGGGCTYPVPENKSYARIPDGVGDWVDPVPTPGGTNVLSEILEISLSVPAALSAISTSTISTSTEISLATTTAAVVIVSPVVGEGDTAVRGEVLEAAATTTEDVIVTNEISEEGAVGEPVALPEEAVEVEIKETEETIIEQEHEEDI